MPTRWDDYDIPHYGKPSGRDYGGGDAGYRGGGFLGGDWPGGQRVPEPSRGQSGPMDRPAPEPSFRGLGPKNYRRSDEGIREDVCELLTDDRDVDATEVEVSVSEGIVTLSGTVGDRGMKRRAESLAESIRGVRDVQNQLRLTR